MKTVKDFIQEALSHQIRAVHVAVDGDAGHKVTIKKKDGGVTIKKFAGEDSYDKAMRHGGAVCKTTDGEVTVHNIT